ncbi:zinc-dependent alcohol dehydrogenase family protein [Lyngbya confervoides]|uniref:Zinc-dependent alcohol dehydrogenase family protein n=1 Tax=Lyngbya confervoides BDU141951 TaxID=1574623 RepID=A0ABD4T7B3_9CYAN|nr:zinc-dependent alcohol dehydrogenase family protein [Lyngbya confervoides]MCM1984145.1 zinc-dependent alcohol dehydrogenase family protein [Lyngbya confervoides BDU141951]
MKAVLLQRPGDPTTLSYQSYPDPQIQQPHQLKIQIKAAGVNPIDTKLRSRGTFYPDQMPAILGCDGSGVVVELGSEVTHFQIGDEVYFCRGGLGDIPGTYCDLTVLEAQYVAPKPQNLDFVQAAAAPLVLITAWEALYDRAQIQPDHTVFVQGGSGGVGHVAIQLAKQRGARVCTTVSTPQKARLAREWGADQVIQYPIESVEEAVRDWTEGVGVDVALDTLGGASLSQCFELARPYGRVVTLLAPASDTAWSTARTKNLTLSYELMLTPMLQGMAAAQQHQVEILKRCKTWFEDQVLQVHVHKTFPLAAAADAHEFLERGGMTGKVVLIP